MAKTLLLTGATGFIGSAFLKKAVGNGFRVKALTRKLVLPVTALPVEFYEVDLCGDVNWCDLLFDVDVIVHAAGESIDFSLMHQVNYEASFRLLESAIKCGVGRWVQLSSVGAYGVVEDEVVSEIREDCPVGLYEKTKSNFDVALLEEAKRSSLEVCIVRPSNVYGVGMRNRSIYELLRAIKTNRFAFVGAEGASANYVHVQDVVQALELCVKHPRAGNQTYIVSAWSTIEDMVRGLSAGAGIAAPSRRIPLLLACYLAKVMQWWSGCPLTPSRVRAMSLRSRYSTEKIEVELGWKLTVPINEGMREFARDLSE